MFGGGVILSGTVFAFGPTVLAVGLVVELGWVFDALLAVVAALGECVVPRPNVQALGERAPGAVPPVDSRARCAKLGALSNPSSVKQAINFHRFMVVPPRCHDSGSLLCVRRPASTGFGTSSEECNANAKLRES